MGCNLTRLYGKYKLLHPSHTAREEVQRNSAMDCQVNYPVNHFQIFVIKPSQCSFFRQRTLRAPITKTISATC
ncbi:hypothetical protein SAMN05660479_01783 [Microbulbifer thermotolerans]|nr:hypothetical protein SAMN05660479_01783 [Microbulbifer thermotolerans]